MFCRLEDGAYVETPHLRTGEEGAIAFIIIPDHMDTTGTDWVPVGLKPRFVLGDKGWFVGGSKRFRADETLVDLDLGIEFALGRVELGGFHISKRNFLLRWQRDSAV